MLTVVPQQAIANRRAGYLSDVQWFGPRVLELQARGLVSTREIRRALNLMGGNGRCRPWSLAAVYRLVQTGAELGLNFPIRDRSTAGRERAQAHQAERRPVFSLGQDGVASTNGT